MRFSIDQKLLEKILNYLATKQYSEVAQMISEVQQDVVVIIEDNVPKEHST